MSDTICGADCAQCAWNGACGGCEQTGGSPFGGGCVLAACCARGGHGRCAQCGKGACGLKARLEAEFNALGIPGMGPVTGLNALPGVYINLEYTLPSGQTAKLLRDDKVYLANQLCIPGESRCYGIAADEEHLVVCRYGEGGTDPELVLYKHWGG